MSGHAGGMVRRMSAAAVLLLTQFVAAQAGGSVACWGWNDHDQCDIPTGIGTPDRPVLSLGAGGCHTVAVISPFMCRGDLNGDGVVDGADRGELFSMWGPVSSDLRSSMATAASTLSISGLYLSTLFLLRECRETSGRACSQVVCTSF